MVATARGERVEFARAAIRAKGAAGSTRVNAYTDDGTGGGHAVAGRADREAARRRGKPGPAARGAEGPPPTGIGR